MEGIAGIYLSSESREKYFAEKPEGITDVVVEFESGEQFIASFFSYQKVWEMRKEYVETGKFLNGSYFWASEMILIDNCEKSTIRKVVEHLLEEGDFLNAFMKISEVS